MVKSLLFQLNMDQRLAEISTVEFHLPGHWLSGTPIIRIGLALRVNILNWNGSTYFYGLNFPPIFRIYLRNNVLMFYLYANKYAA